jgi:anion-transporting  ArsA/GET3 family ATPase
MGALLKAEGTTFLLVTTPATSRVSEGAAFAEALLERGLSAAAIVANRVHPWAIEGGIDASVLESGGGESNLPVEVARELRALAAREQVRAEGDARQLRQVASKSGLPAVLVPELESDVHDLRSLATVAAWLIEAEAAS